MKIFFNKIINNSKCLMVSNQSKVKNKVRLYDFFITTKNELLTILKN